MDDEVVDVVVETDEEDEEGADELIEVEAVLVVETLEELAELDELEEIEVLEVLNNAAWYTLSRNDPPQYSDALPLQTRLHPLLAGTLPPGAITDPAPKLFPQ